MKASLVRLSALAVLFVASSASSALAADPAGSPSSLALPDPLELTAATVVAVPSPPEPTLELLHVTLPETQFAGVHYRPRSSGQWGRHMDSQMVSQIHIGFFDPSGPPGRQFLLGGRIGPMVDPHVQLGVALDWSHITDNSTSVSHQSTGPTGITITTQRALSQETTDLFPAMAFVQVNGNDNMTVIPYVGLAGGYEWMSLSASDYQTNASFDATYGGWGWQLYGGAAIPLSGQARVSAELYVNTADLGRDVTDELGLTYRETVSADGVGARLGIAWGF